MNGQLIAVGLMLLGVGGFAVVRLLVFGAFQSGAEMLAMLLWHEECNRGGQL